MAMELRHLRYFVAVAEEGSLTTAAALRLHTSHFVIIPAASSSIGLAAIQITNLAGATSIALTRTSAKKKQLLEAGAAHVIATEEQDMVAEVMRITNGNGAQVAFDPVGGPNFPKLISALAQEGIAYI